MALLLTSACPATPAGEAGEGSEDTDTGSSDDTTDADESYFVKSEFDGLAGTGLRLRQGDDELEIIALDDVTFETPHLPGDPYQVEIIAQPRWPAQTCVVLDAAGVFAEADVEVTVQCTNDPAAGLDPSYGDAGLVILDDFSGVSDSPDVPFNVSLAPDGGVVIAGQALSANEFDGILWRLDADGMPLVSFGDEGLVLHDQMVFETFAAAEVAVDGSVYATGRRFVPMAGADVMIVHYLADGTLDPAFGDGGSVLYDNLLGGCPDQFVTDNPMDLQMTPAGLLISGSTIEPDCEDTDAFIVKVDLVTGSLDPGFGVNGVFSAQGVGANQDARNDIGTALVTREDDTIWLAGLNTAVGGTDQESALIWSVNADGTLDAAFADEGLLRVSQASSSHAWSVDRALDGSAFVAGEEHGDATILALWRVLSSGSLDPAFGDDGTIRVTNDGRYVSARRVAVDSLDRVVVVGTRNNLADQADVAVWRFDANGEPDPGFGDAGLFVWDGLARDVGFGLTLDTSDRIIVSASMITPDEDVAMVILRIDEP